MNPAPYSIGLRANAIKGLFGEASICVNWVVLIVLYAAWAAVSPPAPTDRSLSLQRIDAMLIS